MATNDRQQGNPVDPVSGSGMTPPTNHKAVYAVLITIIVLLVGAVVYLAMGRKSEQPNNQQTNNQITNPTPTPTPTPEPTPTPNPTSTNPTTNWKTYTNTQNKVEFKYPSNFKVITDKVHITYGNGTQWHRFEMQDTSSTQKPYMIFETNPDGYGPFFPSLVYKLRENSDGTLQIVSKEKQSGENVSETAILIVVQPLDSRNGNTYSWRFDYKAGSTDYQAVFDQILSTFKFTK